MKAELQFLTLPPERRALAFEQAAIQRGLDAVIVEKDFWVCWLLGLLFAAEPLAANLVFKGGTSLSKVFGVIDRFSEDVDLSLSPSFVGVSMLDFGELASRTQRDEAMAEMQRLCTVKVEESVQPELEATIARVLGARESGERWLQFRADAQSGSPTLYFHYPATKPTGLDYIERSVKLELGSLTEQQPVGRHPIRPWIADTLPALFRDWACEVVVLGLDRSFWEKATILHAEFYRAPGEKMPSRYARHYADTARLLSHPDAPTFLADRATCDRVAEWKRHFFARRWAHYELARHGTFRLVPPPERLAGLAADYAIMKPMFLTQPPPLDSIIETLREAEETINST